MTKQEIVERCNRIYGLVEALTSTVESLLDDIKIIERLTEELPAEDNDIEDTKVEDEQLSDDKPKE